MDEDGEDSDQQVVPVERTDQTVVVMPDYSHITDAGILKLIKVLMKRSFVDPTATGEEEPEEKDDEYSDESDTGEVCQKTIAAELQWLVNYDRRRRIYAKKMRKVIRKRIDPEGKCRPFPLIRWRGCARAREYNRKDEKERREYENEVRSLLERKEEDDCYEWPDGESEEDDLTVAEGEEKLVIFYPTDFQKDIDMLDDDEWRKLCYEEYYKLREGAIERLVTTPMAMWARYQNRTKAKDYQQDLSGTRLAPLMKRPWDNLPNTEPRVAATRDLRVAICRKVPLLEIRTPFQGVDVDWDSVWFEDWTGSPDNDAATDSASQDNSESSRTQLGDVDDAPKPRLFEKPKVPSNVAAFRIEVHVATDEERQNSIYRDDDGWQLYTPDEPQWYAALEEENENAPTATESQPATPQEDTEPAEERSPTPVQYVPISDYMMCYGLDAVWSVTEGAPSGRGPGAGRVVFVHPPVRRAARPGVNGRELAPVDEALPVHEAVRSQFSDLRVEELNEDQVAVSPKRGSAEAIRQTRPSEAGGRQAAEQPSTSHSNRIEMIRCVPYPLLEEELNRRVAAILCAASEEEAAAQESEAPTVQTMQPPDDEELPQKSIEMIAQLRSALQPIIAPRKRGRPKKSEPMPEAKRPFPSFQRARLAVQPPARILESQLPLKKRKVSFASEVGWDVEEPPAKRTPIRGRKIAETPSTEEGSAKSERSSKDLQSEVTTQELTPVKRTPRGRKGPTDFSEMMTGPSNESTDIRNAIAAEDSFFGTVLTSPESMIPVASRFDATAAHPRSRTRRNAAIREAEANRSPEKKVTRRAKKIDEEAMPAPSIPERVTATPDTITLDSTAAPSRASSVVSDVPSESSNYSSSYATFGSGEVDKYMLAPKKYLLRRAQMSSSTETPPPPAPIPHPPVVRQPSQDEVRFLTPPPKTFSPDIIILEPPQKDPAEIKREQEEALLMLMQQVPETQITDREYDEDGVDDPPIGAPLIYACDFTSIDKSDLNMDRVPFPPESVRVDANCFTHIVSNFYRGQKFTVLPRMTDRYGLLKYEDDLFELLTADIDSPPIFLKDDLYNLACERPLELVKHAMNNFSESAMQVLTRDKDPTLAKKQLLTSNKIRELMVFFLKRRQELLEALAATALGRTDGPDYNQLKDLYDRTMNIIQVRICDNLMGLSEETRGWEPTLNVLKRRFEAFLFGWRSFLLQGGVLRCFQRKFGQEMHPVARATLDSWIGNNDILIEKISRELTKGPEVRAYELVEKWTNGSAGALWNLSLLEVKAARSETHVYGCGDPCNIWFNREDLLQFHRNLHDYKPFECSCFLPFSHQLALHLHYLDRHSIEILNGEITLE